MLASLRGCTEMANMFVEYQDKKKNTDALITIIVSKYTVLNKTKVTNLKNKVYERSKQDTNSDN